MKFMEEILVKKLKLDGDGVIVLTKKCCVIIERRSLLNLKDSSTFTIPCSIGARYFDKALCNLGGILASVNIIPRLVFKKLGLKKNKTKPTNIILQMVNGSLRKPLEIDTLIL